LAVAELAEVGLRRRQVHQDLTQLFRVPGSHTPLKVEQVARAGLQQLVEQVELVEPVELEAMAPEVVEAQVTAHHLTQLLELSEIYTLEQMALMGLQQQLLTHRVCDMAVAVVVV
jgi:hypothetical protein